MGKLKPSEYKDIDESRRLAKGDIRVLVRNFLWCIGILAVWIWGSRELAWFLLAMHLGTYIIAQLRYIAICIREYKVNWS